MRHQVNALLVPDCIANIIRSWLIANADNTGRTGNRALTIMLDTVNFVLLHETRDNLLPDRF